jgi:hypothetical protein
MTFRPLQQQHHRHSADEVNHPRRRTRDEAAPLSESQPRPGEAVAPGLSLPASPAPPRGSPDSELITRPSRPFALYPRNSARVHGPGPRRRRTRCNSSAEVSHKAGARGHRRRSRDRRGPVIASDRARPWRSLTLAAASGVLLLRHHPPCFTLRFVGEAKRSITLGTGGEGGIRTHETLARPTVFRCASGVDRSGLVSLVPRSATLRRGGGYGTGVDTRSPSPVP